MPLFRPFGVRSIPNTEQVDTGQISVNEPGFAVITTDPPDAMSENVDEDQ
jgi:hypothetical protein